MRLLNYFALSVTMASLAGCYVVVPPPGPVEIQQPAQTIAPPQQTVYIPTQPVSPPIQHDIIRGQTRHPATQTVQPPKSKTVQPPASKDVHKPKSKPLDTSTQDVQIPTKTTTNIPLKNN